MKTFKTKTPKPILNDRQKLIDNFIIYLVIEDFRIINNNFIAKGYYYYKITETIDGQDFERVVKLKDVGTGGGGTVLSWEMASQIEVYILQPVNSDTLIENFLQRLVEFTFLQLEQESGENWGTTRNDWELCEI